MDNCSHWPPIRSSRDVKEKNYFFLYFFVCFPARCHRERGVGWCWFKWLYEGDTFCLASTGSESDKWRFPVGSALLMLKLFSRSPSTFGSFFSSLFFPPLLCTLFVLFL